MFEYAETPAGYVDADVYMDEHGEVRFTSEDEPVGRVGKGGHGTWVGLAYAHPDDEYSLQVSAYNPLDAARFLAHAVRQREEFDR